MKVDKQRQAEGFLSNDPLKKLVAETVERRTRTITVVMSHQKLDEILAYISGLLGFIFGVIYWFVAGYSECDCIGQDSKCQQKHFDFCAYLGYLIYSGLNYLACSPNGTECKKFTKLVYRLLRRKLNYFQNMSNILMSDSQRTGLFLVIQPSLQWQESVRQMYEDADFYLKSKDEDEGCKGIVKYLQTDNMESSKSIELEPAEISAQIQSSEIRILKDRKKNINDDKETSQSEEFRNHQLEIKFMRSIRNIMREVKDQNTISQRLVRLLNLAWQEIGGTDKVAQEIPISTTRRFKVQKYK